MKGPREPLLLVATGLFLLSMSYLMFLPMILGFAGIALGMHDLRKSEAAPMLGGLRVASAVLAWITCAGVLIALVLQSGEFLILSFLPALSCALLVLRSLARHAGSPALARAFLVLSITPYAGVPLGLAGLPNLGAAALIVSTLTAAVLALRLRARTVPYGNHALREKRP